MNNRQTNWNFRHIEFLIDIVEDAKDINKLSATKLRRFTELQQAGYVTLRDDKPYAKLTESGEAMLKELEFTMNGRPEQ